MKRRLDGKPAFGVPFSSLEAFSVCCFCNCDSVLKLTSLGALQNHVLLESVSTTENMAPGVHPVIVMIVMASCLAVCWDGRARWAYNSLQHTRPGRRIVMAMAMIITTCMGI